MKFAQKKRRYLFTRYLRFIYVFNKPIPNMYIRTIPNDNSKGTLFLLPQ